MNLVILLSLILTLIGAPQGASAGAAIGSPGVLSGNSWSSSSPCATFGTLA
ncbi:hypothetical protein CONCODRAFT_9578 [Conidiobolus coronatus NRRL 28638]|uniref:Uncharacterized protein n=1 Tax=Conidiobolus coronatus (strain ATCC 28846 / CBS 209.66 / NRRL 28638) TaxID=796925 RepID=A0A137P017_CONC2|nr:hypothetical protein CONCODRAFT_9578 [Conidiobolus coronatus NRRL 28638]|eukprot:KXN68199.1 hypothetical protein CONCODRAFT_9578 [Conidiobolus coronatus NRRL 28638]